MSSDSTISQQVAELAKRKPDEAAFLTADIAMSWREYDERADELATELERRGIGIGDPVGVLLPDGPGVHVAFLAVERAGAVIVGAGVRSGIAELEHLWRLSECRALLCGAEHQGTNTGDLVARMRERGIELRFHLALDAETGALQDSRPAHPIVEPKAGPSRTRSPDDLWLLNSTSGTTGMPKCVVHDQRRWLAFHDFAVDAGALCEDDVFMSVVPAPFGFGIWTAHVTPVLLGVPTVLMSPFEAEGALELIERHRVTVLAAVSTQFIMMLESEALEARDLSSLRVLFTGGEAVPRERASAFEARTGATVLQFYGSNEVGAVSRTTLRDSAEKRWTTAGRVIDEMNVRLFDDEGCDVTASGRGQPGCRGPTLSRGYYADDEANARLLRDDGWMMLGDIVRIDTEGYLTVVGRTDDFIIRGGKNISAAAVEEQVGAHPDVAHVGAVAMPDPVFGERVCAFVELRAGASLELDALCRHLRAQGVSKEYLPEHLVVLDGLPRAAGGKIAKGELRSRAKSLQVEDDP